MAGTLAFTLGKFRVVRNPGHPRYTIENQEGNDALGAPRWSTVKELSHSESSRGSHRPVEDYLLELMSERIDALTARIVNLEKAHPEDKEPF